MFFNNFLQKRLTFAGRCLKFNLLSIGRSSSLSRHPQTVAGHLGGSGSTTVFKNPWIGHPETENAFEPVFHDAIGFDTGFRKIVAYVNDPVTETLAESRTLTGFRSCLRAKLLEDNVSPITKKSLPSLSSPTSPTPRFLRARAIGLMFSLSEKTVVKYANMGKIRGIKPNPRLWLFDPKEVEEDLRSMSTVPRLLIAG